MLNAKDIKDWLKTIGKNREWLAEKTLVSKRTVDNWITTARPIPPAKLSLIEKLMHGEEEIEFELPPDFEKQLRSLADEMHKKLEDMVSYILQVTAREYYKNAAKGEPAHRQFTPVETFSSVAEESYNLAVIGNIAAGSLQPGDTIPYHVKANRPLGKDEYVLRVEGKSMEPIIADGALVVMRKHTIPPIPKPGTIVEYYDERGVTLKNWPERRIRKLGRWTMSYTRLTRSMETSSRWTAGRYPACTWRPSTSGKRRKYRNNDKRVAICIFYGILHTFTLDCFAPWPSGQGAFL